MGFVGYLNGQFVPEDELVVPVTDRGFTLGDAAYDVARTYHHEPRLLDRHMARLFRSLAYLDIDPGIDERAMGARCREVLERNLASLDDDDDLMVVVRVTRGTGPPLYSAFPGPSTPTVVIHCARLPYDNLARAYREGMHLVATSLRRTPATSVDPNAKTHDRLNLVQAHREAARVDPYALPILLDENDHVTETFTANVFGSFDGGLRTPTLHGVLPGITRSVILEIAGELDVPAAETDLTLAGLTQADELFLTATSFGIMPVTRLNGQPVGFGSSGPVTERLMEQFATAVGLDQRAQALRHAGH